MQTHIPQDDIHVLAIEDNLVDRMEVERALGADGERVTITFESTLRAGLARLKQGGFDVLLMDLGLPDSRAEETLRAVKELAGTLPVVVLTGTEQQAWGLEAVRSGAQDYITKGSVPLERILKPSLRYAVARGRHEKELEGAVRRFQGLVENSPDPIFKYRLNPDPGIVYVNNAFEKLLGWSAFEVYGRASMPLALAHEKDRAHFRAMLESGADCRAGLRFVARGGELRWLDLRLVPIEWDQDRAVAVQGTARDVTNQKAVEARLEETREQLLQSQKMEAVGRLAGGVAHDFNNLLTVILGSAELMEMALDRGLGVEREELDQIQEASHRASALTSQLLAFSRRQRVYPRVVDPAKVARSMKKMLRRLLSEEVEIRLEAARGLWRVLVDPGVLEQVILNLAVNARDAMPRGGRLTLRLENARMEKDAPGVLGGEITEGDYVLLVVDDSGAGMDAHILGKAMEPFFTTKEKGRGTGLGLSTSYGQVRQAGGTLALESEPGRGTRVSVYLPRAKGPESVDGPEISDAALKGTERILVAEDDPGVRRLVTRFLWRYGYGVHARADGKAALEAAASLDGLDLLVTDVIMPKMNGVELARALRSRWPGLKVLLVSGYTSDVIEGHGVYEAGIHLLPKPFTGKAFLAEVRRVLDQA